MSTFSDACEAARILKHRFGDLWWWRGTNLMMNIANEDPEFIVCVRATEGSLPMLPGRVFGVTVICRRGGRKPHHC